MESSSFNSNFHSPDLLHFHKQTDKGARIFRSHLYMLAKSEKNQKVIEMLRDLTSNNAPFIHSLELLFQQNTLSFPNKIAIEEGFYTLFSKLLSHRSTSLPKTFSSKFVFEYSRECFCALIEFASKLEIYPDIWNEREKL